MVYLIPAELYEGVTAPIPAYVLQAVADCEAFFVENERTARRYLKRLWPQMVIDNYQWFTIHKAEDSVMKDFVQLLKAGKNIGIMSEAGCPGIADPGQILVAMAQQLGVAVKPLVGPSSILLALMASGLNGQSFSFIGYLPIDSTLRKKEIKNLDQSILKSQTTFLLIETPYRNQGLVQDILDTCSEQIKLCIAVDLTASSERVSTKSIAQWRKKPPTDLHKRPVIFLLGA